MPRRLFIALGCSLLAVAAWWSWAVIAEDAASLPPIEHPPGLSPAESQKQLTVPDDLAVSLVAAEPQVTQPLSIAFDDRARMWVLQYRQYPNPEGLKPVAMDNYLRTKYDKRPDPPPHGPKGQDRLSIYEDTDGDGRSDQVKDFITDLNLASGFALGHGGVFVVQSPYLLFYADRNRDDVPDGEPEVLLTGFGMEDAHAFANSLTWGPDGWLYGAQGSTVTANIRGIEFQQGIWRYHPLTKEFELFAEGGGNTWGVEFDALGNLFASGNEAEPMIHHVQGAYYVKGFGKHGPLHNPHSYGYFQPVQHHGYAGDSLSGGAILYQGGAFPERFNGNCICPNTRHSACRWSTLETRGSTFATRAAGDFILSKDIWFRPVDMTTGPDGAIYVADWYDYNISHSSPTNRSQWYQPSRIDGRVWRVAPPGVKPIKADMFDLGQKTTAELIGLLSDQNDWYARAARRILAERRDRSATAALERLAIESEDQRLALEGLWSAYVTSGKLSDELVAAVVLASGHEYVRAWTVRLLGDARKLSDFHAMLFVEVAEQDPSVVVRSQLACTAKRLPAEQALPIVEKLLAHEEDADDVHVPLLVWWAIEDKAMTATTDILKWFDSPSFWRQPLVEKFIVERLARRFAADDSEAGYSAVARLLAQSPSQADADRVIGGMLEGLSGRQLPALPGPLSEPILGRLQSDPKRANVVELALRLNAPGAGDRAIAIALDGQADAGSRMALIRSLGETHPGAALDGLVALVDDPAESIRLAALQALGYFNDEQIGTELLSRYDKLPSSLQGRVVETLCSRPQWAGQLLAAIDRQELKPAVVSLDQVQKLRSFADEALAKSVAKHWGRVQAATPLEKVGRMTAVGQMLSRKSGDAAAGAALFEKHCATCHKLHGKGNEVGPDLTAAERKNRDLLARSIIDPSAVIRQEYLSHVATTADGRVLVGLLAEANDQTVTLLDAKNKRTTLARHEIDELKESPTSLMPDNLLDTLSEQEIRDLFAYLQADPGK